MTGTVPDVRPYLRFATVSVAPLRIARGIQNKVLEAMAMGCQLVVSPQALEGIEASPDTDLLVADGELAKRKAAWMPPVAMPLRGYAKLYMDHVLQAEHGCDFDFLRKA